MRDLQKRERNESGEKIKPENVRDSRTRREKIQKVREAGERVSQRWQNPGNSSRNLQERERWCRERTTVQSAVRTVKPQNRKSRSAECSEYPRTQERTQKTKRENAVQRTV